MYLAVLSLIYSIWDLQSLLWHVGSFSFGRETVSCCLWDLFPQPRVEPRPAALGVQSLSHWTTREVPSRSFFFLIYVFILIGG